MKKFSTVLLLVAIGFYILLPFDSNPEILQFRFFRLIDVFLVGASLAVVGIVAQSLFQNDLAEPFSLGLSPFAALGMTIAMMLGIHLFIGSLWGAFMGCLITLRVAERAKLFGPKLILLGVIIGFFSSAIMQTLVNWIDSSYYARVQGLLIGDFVSSQEVLSYIIYPLVLAAFGYFFHTASRLDLLTINHDLFLKVHGSFKKIYVESLLFMSILIAYGVYKSGIVGFIGLIIPHFLKSNSPKSHQELIFLSFFIGGSTSLICDRLGQSFVGEIPMPLGLVSMLLGVPIFAFILLKEVKRVPNES